MDRIALLLEANNAVVRCLRIVQARGRKDVSAQVSDLVAALAEALDDHHHAPACPANHYHGQRCPRLRCTCGAWQLGVVMRSHPGLGRDA